MTTSRRITNWTLCLCALVATTGCLNVGVYRTARTLPQGEGDFSLTWSYVRATVAAREVTTQANGEDVAVSEQPATTFGFPNIVPELAYHHGVLDDLELGGRLALAAGLGELDAKYRFYNGARQRLHLAVQPALGYRGLGVISGVNASVPLIATFDLSETLSVNGALFGTYTSYEAAVDNAEDDLDFGGDSVAGGGSAGIQLRAKGGFHVMPALEYQRTLMRRGMVDGLPDISSVIFSVTMGWGPRSE